MSNYFEFIHQTTCLEIPEQNVIVEQKHQYIINIIKALFFPTNLSHQLWSFDAVHVFILINRIPNGR